MKIEEYEIFNFLNQQFILEGFDGVVYEWHRLSLRILYDMKNDAMYFIQKNISEDKVLEINLPWTYPPDFYGKTYTCILREASLHSSKVIAQLEKYALAHKWL